MSSSDGAFLFSLLCSPPPPKILEHRRIDGIDIPQGTRRGARHDRRALVLPGGLKRAKSFNRHIGRRKGVFWWFFWGLFLSLSLFQYLFA